MATRRKDGGQVCCRGRGWSRTLPLHTPNTTLKDPVGGKLQWHLSKVRHLIQCSDALACVGQLHGCLEIRNAAGESCDAVVECKLTRTRFDGRDLHGMHQNIWIEPGLNRTHLSSGLACTHPYIYGCTASVSALALTATNSPRHAGCHRVLIDGSHVRCCTAQSGPQPTVVPISHAPKPTKI